MRYCLVLGEGGFCGRTAHFVTILLLGTTCMAAFTPYVSIHFFESSLSFIVAYAWGRHNKDMHMSFLGVFIFSAPCLLWVMMVFSVLLGHSVTIDASRIMVGHVYAFLEYMCLAVTEIRG